MGTQHNVLLSDLKDDIKRYTVLMRTEFYKRFYLNNEWYPGEIGDMLMHTDINPKPNNADKEEERGV